MHNFETIDEEPAYCEKCKALVVVNYKDENPRCPTCYGECTFYNDPTLSLANKEKKIQWCDFFLPTSDCLCPRCGRKTMEFIYQGNFD